MPLTDDISGHTVMALDLSTRVQNVAIGATSVQSTTFLARQSFTANQDMGQLTPGPSGTSHIRLCSTVDCYILIGSNLTVSATTGTLLPASSPEYFPVQPGDQVSVIQASSAGTLNITEC